MKILEKIEANSQQSYDEVIIVEGSIEHGASVTSSKNIDVQRNIESSVTVDTETGLISVFGNVGVNSTLKASMVTVRGHVGPGVTITCQHDIEVESADPSATLTSEKGTVTVKSQDPQRRAAAARNVSRLFGSSGSVEVAHVSGPGVNVYFPSYLKK